MHPHTGSSPKRRAVPGRRSTRLLADDHPKMLAGLRQVLEPVFNVIETAPDGHALLEAVKRRRPDLVIADISMPGLSGIEAARRLRTAAPGVRVLILSIDDDPSHVQAAFAAGARGYLIYVCAARSRESPPPLAAGTLTRRELDVLRLVAEGLGNHQIARRLGVAVSTIRTHLNSLYGKLRAKSRVELALYASQAGCTTP